MVDQHPDKTFIGQIEWGFTFLGYCITKQGVTGVALRLGKQVEGGSPEFRSRMGPWGGNLAAHRAIHPALEAVGAEWCPKTSSVLSRGLSAWRNDTFSHQTPPYGVKNLRVPVLRSSPSRPVARSMRVPGSGVDETT
jgi:hypothetical protein